MDIDHPAPWVILGVAIGLLLELFFIVIPIDEFRQQHKNNVEEGLEAGVLMHDPKTGDIVPVMCPIVESPNAG